MTVRMLPDDAHWFSDEALIEVLQHRGYRVFENNRARTALSWHRAEPFPPCLDFKKEALVKIRSLLSEEHLDFSTEARPGWDGKAVRNVNIHSARLRVFR